MGYDNGRSMMVTMQIRMNLKVLMLMMIMLANHYYGGDDDDTDDDNDHKKDSYTAAGAAPTQTRPEQALYRCCEAQDRSNMKS